ncbi:MAG TPA: lysophospholipid acyltransferase family protein [Pyrinomonadaceae bacterium]|jgi:1-acyl-sn-glycerol-3-phosphate acyltransferase
MSLPELGTSPPRPAFDDQRTDVALSACTPTRQELAVLAPMERFAFRVTHRMNAGAWKRFWTACQRTLGAGWIRLATYNLMNVYGLAHVEAIDHERPLLLVANHRSFFDMYVVSAELFRRTRWRKKLFFPVRGRFFYESLLGMFVNFIMGWWSMYPPFFAGGDKPLVDKREFDKFSVRRLVDLCQHGAGHVIGFHPEGTRNKGADPYSYLRPQPGIGRVIKEADPQVIPVFIAGLGNDLPRQILGNWTGGPPVRIHFGPLIDFAAFKTKPDRLRTHKEIADFVMAQIAALGEQDRALYAEPSERSTMAAGQR